MLEWDNASVRWKWWRDLTYLLTYDRHRTMETTVVNTLASTDWSVGFRIQRIGSSVLRNIGRWCCFTANVLRFADYWWFSRVSEAWKEVRLSEEILGISKSGQFLPLWSYTWTGIAVRVMCDDLWSRLWSCGLERCLKLKTSEVIWMLLLINCS